MVGTTGVMRRVLAEMRVPFLHKGVEIHSSIETPKEIKVLFPLQKDTAVLPDNILKLM